MSAPEQDTEAKLTSFVPNSYSTPNAFVDQLMHLLEPKEWVVLSYVCRHILGWKDKIASRTGALSISMIVDGFETSKGERYHGCGLGKSTVLTALASLAKYKIVVKVGKPTKAGQYYRVPDDDSGIDYAGLQKRVLDKIPKSQARTEKARQKAIDKRSIGLSDRPEVVSQTDQHRSVPQTESGLSHRPNKYYIKPQQNHTSLPEVAPMGTSDTPPADQKSVAPKDKAAKPKKPAINQVLKDAIAINLQGLSPNEAVAITGLLANKAMSIWTNRLGVASLTAEQYEKVARSIPEFVKWFWTSFPYADTLPTKLETFENRYQQFVSGVNPKSKPVDNSPWGSTDSDDPSTWLDPSLMVGAA